MHNHIWLLVCVCVYLIPIFNLTIPAGCNQFARLMRMPQCTDADTFMRLPFLIHFRRLPIPNVALAITITRHQVAHIGRKVQLAGIAGDHVTSEGFLAIHFETIQRGKYHDFVIQRLTGHPFAIRCQSDRGHGMHCRISYILHVHRYVPFPDTHGFVIRCGHKSAIIIDKRNRTDRAQMTIVFLHNVATACVPL